MVGVTHRKTTTYQQVSRDEDLVRNLATEADFMTTMKRSKQGLRNRVKRDITHWSGVLAADNASRALRERIEDGHLRHEELRREYNARDQESIDEKHRFRLERAMRAKEAHDREQERKAEAQHEANMRAQANESLFNQRKEEELMMKLEKEEEKRIRHLNARRAMEWQQVRLREQHEEKQHKFEVNMTRHKNFEQEMAEERRMIAEEKTEAARIHAQHAQDELDQKTQRYFKDLEEAKLRHDSMVDELMAQRQEIAERRDRLRQERQLNRLRHEEMELEQREDKRHENEARASRMALMERYRRKKIDELASKKLELEKREAEIKALAQMALQSGSDQHHDLIHKKLAELSFDLLGEVYNPPIQSQSRSFSRDRSDDCLNSSGSSSRPSSPKKKQNGFGYSPFSRGHSQPPALMCR